MAAAKAKHGQLIARLDRRTGHLEEVDRVLSPDEKTWKLTPERLKKMNRKTWIVLCLCSAIAGLIAGGFLFSDTQQRAPIRLDRCRKCSSSAELAGLLASVGIQRFPSSLPGVVLQTERTVVIKHPRPTARMHYVLIPRKDIRNIGQISAGDDPYLVDVFACVAKIVQQQRLTRYRVITNGPGYQSVSYLHFHLISD